MSEIRYEYAILTVAWRIRSYKASGVMSATVQVLVLKAAIAVAIKPVCHSSGSHLNCVIHYMLCFTKVLQKKFTMRKFYKKVSMCIYVRVQLEKIKIMCPETNLRKQAYYETFPEPHHTHFILSDSDQDPRAKCE